MKSRAIESEKRNIFGIIKESVFGSVADFFKTLSSTEADDIENEVESPETKAEVSKMERTTFDSDDVVEVEAGKTVNFGRLNAYKRKVDVGKAVRTHEEKVKQKNQEEINRAPEKEGSARTRGAR